MTNGNAELWNYSCTIYDWTRSGSLNLIGSAGGHVTSVVYDGKSCTLFWCEESQKNAKNKLSYSVCSSNLPKGKRFQLRIQDFPLGGGGADLRRGHFSAETHTKTKELGPVGGGLHPLDPPLGPLPLPLLVIGPVHIERFSEREQFILAGYFLWLARGFCKCAQQPFF